MVIRKPKFSHKSTAQAMAEFALVLPILLLVVYGLLETGRLLFIYASTVTASRQAVRYGSATGTNDAGIPFFQDCNGIIAAVQNVGFINRFNAADIHITYDRGVDSSGNPIAISGIDPSPNADECPVPTGVIASGDRIKVQVSTQWNPIVPLVPLRPFTITSESARTIIGNISIEVDTPPGEFTGTDNPPATSGIPDVNAFEDDPDYSIDLWLSFEDTEDPDSALTYTILENDNPLLFTSVTINANQYLVLDYAPNAYGTAHITVLAVDTDGNPVQATFTVVVNPVNDPPTDIALSYNFVDENLPTGAIVGVLTTTDADNPYDTFTYSRCPGETDPFTFSGNTLVTADILDYENISSYSLCIRSTDSAGAYIERTFTINVNDTVDPLGTFTPSATPTSTLTPTITPTPTMSPTPTYTPTITPTAVSSCSALTVTHGSLVISGSTMRMNISNGSGYVLYPSQISVSWYHFKGHKVTDDKTLRLQEASLISAGVTNTFWTGDIYAPSYTLEPSNATMPAIPTGNSTIVFTFHQSYEQQDGTERILITIGTNGCNNLTLDSNN